MKQKICLFLYIALLAVKILAQNIAVPELHARVTDLTSTLTAEQTQTLTNTIIQFEQQNPQNAQLAILILPTTGGNTIEQYATKVFNQWKLGSKEHNNGVLILVAKNDRKVRIEVGYGLESTITDALAGRIIQEQITPQFRNNNYFAGIAQATTVLTNLINTGTYNAPPDHTPAPNQSIDRNNIIPFTPLTTIAIYYGISITISVLLLFIFQKRRHNSELSDQLSSGLNSILSAPDQTNKWTQYKNIKSRIKKWQIILLTMIICTLLLLLRNYFWIKKSFLESILLGLLATGIPTWFALFVFIINIFKSGYSSSDDKDDDYSSDYSDSSSDDYSGGGGSSGGGGASGSW